MECNWEFRWNCQRTCWVNVSACVLDGIEKNKINEKGDISQSGKIPYRFRVSLVQIGSQRESVGQAFGLFRSHSWSRAIVIRTPITRAYAKGCILEARDKSYELTGNDKELLKLQQAFVISAIYTEQGGTTWPTNIRQACRTSSRLWSFARKLQALARWRRMCPQSRVGWHRLIALFDSEVFSEVVAQILGLEYNSSGFEVDSPSDYRPMMFWLERCLSYHSLLRARSWKEYFHLSQKS